MLATLIACSFACSKRTAQTPPGGAIANDSSFLDLKAGGRLKVVVPLLKAGGDRAILATEQTKSGSLTLSAPDLLGYQSSYYFIAGRPDGVVRLRFQSAETSKEGVTAALPKAPDLPFALPKKRQHIRLIYLVRQSRSDHNMAIVASKDLAALSRLTQDLKKDSSLCTSEGETFCAWVPAGVAVRAE